RESDRIVIIVDGQRVEGVFVWLERDDMEVRITAPFEGPQTGSYIPTFARLYGRYTDAEGRLTDKGRKCAEALLEELYRAGPPRASEADRGRPFAAWPPAGAFSPVSITHPP